MPKNTVVRSLDKDDTDLYTAMRARVSGDTLIVQGQGKCVNREYGVLDFMHLSHYNVWYPNLREWLEKIPRTVPSLEPGSKRTYFPVYVTKYRSFHEWLSIQISGPELNVEFGADLKTGPDWLIFTTYFVDDKFPDVNTLES